MSNMFSGKKEKQIPQNLSECIKPDETVTNLHTWAERLEYWGSILFGLLIAIGIVSTIIETIEVANINEDLAFSACVTSLITWGLYAFIEYCAYHALALLISALGSITQNTIITANIALYEASKNAPNVDPVQSAPQSTPKFSAASFSPDSYTPAPKAPAPTADTWVCKNCGTSNKKEYGQCKKCGQYRS